MQPTWKPFASEMLAEQQLRFSLRLMTGGDTSENDKFQADVGGKKTLWVAAGG